MVVQKVLLEKKKELASLEMAEVVFFKMVEMWKYINAKD